VEVVGTARVMHAVEVWCCLTPLALVLSPDYVDHPSAGPVAPLLSDDLCCAFDIL
jgi:hypothetical protein